MLTNKIVRNLIVGIVMVGGCHASGSDAPTPTPEPSAPARPALELPVITITFPPDPYQTEPPAPGSEAPKTTYTSITSSQQMEQFVYDCLHGTTIILNTHQLTFDQATETIINNTIYQLTNSLYRDIPTFLTALAENPEEPSLQPLKKLIATIAWVGYYQFSPVSPDTSQILLPILHQLAPTNFQKAKLLLLSQTNDDYIPIDDADWTLIAQAIHILKHEGNGHYDDAKELIDNLKTKDQYSPILGDYTCSE